ncbi:NrsF family protein [Novosphingobium sp.]|uniref:NrsF family protein n=1 Tax=Novosphingobium sp. TaxID=1874826 RepID=UPI0035B0645E
MPHDPDTFIAGLVADLAPVRPLRQRAGMGRAILALLAGVLGMVTMFGLRSDLASGHPDAMLLLSGGLFLVLTLASSWAVIDMARPYVGIRREGWGWTALMAAVLPLAAMVQWLVARLGGQAMTLDSDGINCLKFGLVWGLITAAVLTLWLRRGAPSRPDRAGLMAGVASGSAGIFAVALYCPHNDLLHIGVWHGATVVIAGLVGRLVIPRLIAW